MNWRNQNKLSLVCCITHCLMNFYKTKMFYLWIWKLLNWIFCYFQGFDEWTQVTVTTKLGQIFMVWKGKWRFYKFKNYCIHWTWTYSGFSITQFDELVYHDVFSVHWFKSSNFKWNFIKKKNWNELITF